MLANRASPRGKRLADRHYNRQRPDSVQFVPPGRCVVLITEEENALWISSWPLAAYVKHAWAGAWVCSCFRHEGPGLASSLNRDAVAATRALWPDVPAIPSTAGPVGMVSFIDRGKVRPTLCRGKKTWGWTWFKAGWEVIGE